MGEEDAQTQSEVEVAEKTNMLNTADLVEKSAGQDASEQLDVDMDIDVPPDSKPNADIDACLEDQLEHTHEQKHDSDSKVERENELGIESTLQSENGKTLLESDVKEGQFKGNSLNETPWSMKQEREVGEFHNQVDGSNQAFSFDSSYSDGDVSGTEEEQAAFMNVLENFFKERSMEFKPPKFYGEGLNCLKLWRAVTRLGGYDQVTSSKLWRQVGESFKPPKTCTTVSWSFRCFYEKALLEYEKHKIGNGELHIIVPPIPEPLSVDSQAVVGNQAAGSGRARRDAAARAMQGWHSQRFLFNGEVADPIIKDKSSVSLPKRDKHLKTIGPMLKRKNPSSVERVKAARTKENKPQVDSMVVDVGAPADWVKINVQRTKDCFEVYALVPGLLREEVHVQSDPAGRLIISGEPEQPDNPWGVTAFKKVITLPSRIDPHQTSAVVTLHGQLFVRAPFEHSES